MSFNKGHLNHKVLGQYCWDCGLKTKAGVPGWARQSHSDSETYQDPWTKSEMTGLGYCRSISWANGDIHSQRDQRPCVLCNKHCKNPVERGFTAQSNKYREIFVKSCNKN